MISGENNQSGKIHFLEKIWGVLDGGNWMIFFWSSDQMFSIKADKISTGII
jgi:hypothetical protein